MLQKTRRMKLTIHIVQLSAEKWTFNVAFILDQLRCNNKFLVMIVLNISTCCMIRYRNYQKGSIRQFTFLEFPTLQTVNAYRILFLCYLLCFNGIGTSQSKQQKCQTHQIVQCHVRKTRQNDKVSQTTKGNKFWFIYRPKFFCS